MSSPSFDTSPIVLWSNHQHSSDTHTDRARVFRLFTVPPLDPSTPTAADINVIQKGDSIGGEEEDHVHASIDTESGVFLDIGAICSMCSFSMRTTVYPPDSRMTPLSEPHSRRGHSRARITRTGPEFERLFAVGGDRGLFSLFRLRVPVPDPSRSCSRSRSRGDFFEMPSIETVPVVHSAWIPDRVPAFPVSQIEAAAMSRSQDSSEEEGVSIGDVLLHESRIIYARSEKYVRAYLLRPEDGTRSVANARLDTFGRYVRLGEEADFYGPNDVLRPSDAMYWGISGNIVHIRPFVKCGERLCVLLEDSKDDSRSMSEDSHPTVVRVVDFRKSLMDTDSGPELIWETSGNARERQTYVCAVAGAGILGGVSSAASVFAVAGFGFPDAFRISQTHEGGGLIDVFDIRTARKAPVIQVYSAYERNPFNSIVRVRTASGWGLVTTTAHGRVQLWDLRMLQGQKSQSQSRCDGSQPVGDWIVSFAGAGTEIDRDVVGSLNQIKYCANVEARKLRPDPKQIHLVTPSSAEMSQGMPSVARCEALPIDFGGDSIMIVTPDGLFRWSNFGLECPKVEELVHAFVERDGIVGTACNLGCCCCMDVEEENEDDERFLSPLPVDAALSRVDGVVALLEKFSDFTLRCGGVRIRFFRSLLLDSRYYETILKKKSARIQWSLPHVESTALLRFLIGVRSALDPASLLDYFILFVELGMTQRAYRYHVCLQAESLSDPSLVLSLLVDARERLPAVLRARNATTDWDTIPIVCALLNALNSADQSRVTELLVSEECHFLRELLTRPNVPVFRLKVFHRAKKATFESLLQRSFSRLAKESPPSGNVSLTVRDYRRRVHAECLVYRSEFFRALFAFGGQDAFGSRSFDVAETFASRMTLDAYVHYAYTGSLPDVFSILDAFQVLGISDRILDDDLTRLCLDSIASLSKELSVSGSFRRFLLEEGHLFLEVGREWIQRELLATWSSIGEEEEEVLRLIHQSVKILEEAD